MKLKLAALLVLFASPAFAQVAPPKPDVPDTSTELTFTQILTIESGLNALDGFQKIIEDGGKEKAVLQPYVLSENTRSAIADNEVALQDAITNAQAKSKVYAKSLGPNYTDATTKEGKEWIEYSNDAMTKTAKVIIVKFSRADLQLKTNAIPPSVLSAIDPLMEKAK
jgi:hypothetical protein